MPLTDNQMDQFVNEGFFKVEGVFSADLGELCRRELWDATGRDPNDPETWTEPVVRLGGFDSPPFRAAGNTPPAGGVRSARWARWVDPPRGARDISVRFPSEDPPGDDGWHAGTSYAGAQGETRLNLRSRDRALLMLFLFSDVAAEDAPTRVRVGSHLDVPALLGPAGGDGVEWISLCERAVAASASRPVELATGRVEDVHLCHPFLVHAAQPHRGQTPRFMAQPPLHPARPLDLDAAIPTPVALAILRASAHEVQIADKPPSIATLRSPLAAAGPEPRSARERHQAHLGTDSCRPHRGRLWPHGDPPAGTPRPSRGLPRVTDACSANGDCRGQRASCISARAMSLVLVTIAL